MIRKQTRTINIFIIVSIVVFFGWKYLFAGNPLTDAIFVNTFLITVIAMCFIALFKAYRKVQSRQKNFWLLASIVGFFYLTGNLIWYYTQVITESEGLLSAVYLFWMLAYMFFLIALIYRIKNVNSKSFNNGYIFNIIIFMITTASIMINYLLDPIFQLMEKSLLNTVITLIFSIVGLAILLSITILYYLIHKNKEKRVLFLMISGFLIHLIADTYFIYLQTTGSFYSMHPISLLWIISVGLIGFAGYYVDEDREVSAKHKQKTIRMQEAIIPYVSTIILVFLVFFNNRGEVDVLRLGLLFTVLLIIPRQIFVLKENGKLMEEFRYQAYHDPLTGLLNRKSFHEQLENVIEKDKYETTGLLLMDLDRFKIINDTLGHHAGDRLLVKAADCLQQSMKSDAQLFRLGGDEFVVILTKTTEKECVRMARELLKRFQEVFSVQDNEVIVTGSIGISMYPKHGATVDELFKYADAAMYLAKDSGRNRFRFYDDDLSHIMARRMKIENELRKGVERNQFEVYYQSKVELKTRQIVGMEALLRWKHPELGWISPAEFIPIAEETGSIVHIGEWVLNTACKQSREWQQRGFPPLHISVNVSVRQFQQGNLLEIIRAALQESRLAPELLEIEITESIMQNTDKNLDILNEIRELGVHISIDDFGTGYSSLYVIQELPINTIKLDKTFIAKIHNKKQQAMIKTIIDLAGNLDLEVVAEGIEYEDQLKVLLEHKCHIGQGYLFSKPVDSKNFEKLFNETPRQKSLSHREDVK